MGRSYVVPPSNANIGIVGAGLASLSCGYELKKNGISATLYEAGNPVGGLCFSLGGSFGGAVNFPNQVLEGCGELIDTLHKTMIGYARKFGLTFTDVGKQRKEIFYYFADNKSKFVRFGIFSDKHYHIIGSNKQIAQGLCNKLQEQINLEMRLVKVNKNATNRIKLTFQNNSQTTKATYDAVAIARPFTALHEVELDPSFELPAWKRSAIAKLSYGTNAKMMIGFDQRLWTAQGSNGKSYSNLVNHQTTWKSDPTKATNTSAVLTDYSSGNRGASLNPNQVQLEATKFLTDLDHVSPGALVPASHDAKGKIKAYLEHWSSNPLTKGSYAGYQPGQFTTIANNEGKPIGNLHFAGEHTSSFHQWQGYMEGATTSIQAANKILQDIKVGKL